MQVIPKGEKFWRVQKFTRPDGVEEITYKATSEGLADCIVKMQKGDGENCQDISVSGPDGVIFTLKGHVYGAAGTAGSKQAWEIVPPDVTLQGAFVSAPLCQAPTFGLGSDNAEKNPLTVQQVQAVESLLRENGVVTQSALDALNTDKCATYAGWLMAGIKTYEAPSFVLQVTHHISPAKQDAASTALAKYANMAGKVFKNWTDIMTYIPKFLQPKQPTGFNEWLVVPLTQRNSIREVTVNITFIGAQTFPNLYGGSRDAPALNY